MEAELVNIEELIEKCFMRVIGKKKTKKEILYIMRDDALEEDKQTLQSNINECIKYLHEKENIMDTRMYGKTVPIIFEYNEPVLIPKTGRLYYHQFNKCRLYLHDRADMKFGIAYGKTKYYDIEYLNFHKLKSLSFCEPVSDEELQKKKLELIQKARYDDKTWSNLSELNDVCYIEGNRLIDIRKKFNIYDLQRIREVFEKKESLYMNRQSEKRRYSIEACIGEDGVFRAWFVSAPLDDSYEDTYILLNPTHCILRDRD